MILFLFHIEHVRFSRFNISAPRKSDDRRYSSLPAGLHGANGPNATVRGPDHHCPDLDLDIYIPCHTCPQVCGDELAYCTVVSNWQKLVYVQSYSNGSLIK